MDNKKTNKFNSLFLFALVCLLGFGLRFLMVQTQQAGPLERQIEAILAKDAALFSPQFRRDFVPYLVATAQDHEIDPLLVLAVMKVESTFRPDAISNRGAMGLLQIKPVAAQEVVKVFGLEAAAKKNLLDPYHNVRVGVRYLSYLKKMFRKDRIRMLSAYNMGPTTVRRTGIQSSRYSRKVMRTYYAYLSHDPELLLARK